MGVRGFLLTFRCLALLLLVAGTYSAQSQTFTVLYSWTHSNGANPHAGLLRSSSGKLYGTTTYGGTSNRGSVFMLDSSGRYSVLYSFAGRADGQFPWAGLTRDSNGNLYGTTTGGGANGFGTVFKLDTTGVHTVLYSFASLPSDGADPRTNLVLDRAGNLYGTTSLGGLDNEGTVYKIDTRSVETVVYSFLRGSPDGNLILSPAGSLYGTTTQGGTHDLGTVFELNPVTGQERILHSFSGGSDSSTPVGGLLRDSLGNLYGTTVGGSCPSSCGTVFMLNNAGTETILHTFTGTGGWDSQATLIRDKAGTLYGTTVLGGSGCGSIGCGTAFKLDTAGTLTVLHSFTNSDDGSNPYAGLVIDSEGILYGTDAEGSANNVGTVFEITP